MKMPRCTHTEEAVHQACAPVPLVTDLDDTLLATDSLWEGIAAMLVREPAALFRFPVWLGEGRLAFKWRFAGMAAARASSFPCHEAVQAVLAEASRQGRPVFLATAAPRPVAEAVAGRLGLFTGIFASDRVTNLKGADKAACLCAHFGEKAFDYIGDSKADMPVWQVCRRAIVAGNARLFREVSRRHGDCALLPLPTGGLRELICAMRVRQWAKNLLVIVPLLLAHLFSLSAAFMALLAFISFSLCASAIYLINDICDLDHDRKHPQKKARPFASGALPLRSAPLLMGVLLLAAAGAACPLPAEFWGLLGGYICTTTAYSLFFKKGLLVDVVVLTGCYVLRVMAGAAAVGSTMSNWLLGFIFFFFLGLALLKRSGALSLLSPQASLPGRAYEARDYALIECMAVCSGFAAIIIMALYVNSFQAAQLYARPQWLWGACPVLLCWYGRFVLLAHRGLMRDDPVAFALQDRGSWISLGLLLAVALLAL